MLSIFYLIRHGQTEANRQKRYLGRTEEPLCAEGYRQLTRLAACLPACPIVFASPQWRCRQSAALLYPGQTPYWVDDLRECDFGQFENRSAAELADDPAYAAWLDSGCQAPIPGGEDPHAFRERCCRAFAQIAFAPQAPKRAAFILHGGSIMAILARFSQPSKDFYDYHLDNGECYLCTASRGRLHLCARLPLDTAKTKNQK